MTSLPHVGVSLRTRLTLWYGVLLAVTLLGFSAILYLTLERSLSASVDETLRVRAEQIRRSLLGPYIGILLQPEDVPPGQTEARPLDEFAAPGIYVQVLNPRGGVVSAPANLAGGELPVVAPALEAMRNGQITVITVPVGETNVRVLTAPLRAGTEVVGGVQVGQSLSPLESTMAAVAHLLLVTGVGALLLAVVVGWLLTHQALRPVARMTATARHIAETGDYRQRLEVGRPSVGRGDELVSLAETFNAMVGRLEHLLESQRRLLADTSHELRNPLTVIRGNLALLRRAEVPEDSRREAVLESEDEAARMSRLVTDLLVLARADAGQLPDLRRETVDLGEIAAEVVEQAQPRAGHRLLEVQAPSLVLILGDRDRLKQLISNLVENALRHTADTGRIQVRVSVPPAPMQQRSKAARSPSVENQVPVAFLTVTDDGVGMAAEHLPHLFERFYRADPARVRWGGGSSGLGLSIAQYVAQAHGGSIEAESRGPGAGATFRVRLPMLNTDTATVRETARKSPSARRRRLPRFPKRAEHPVP